ncbi:hypothetical protein BJ508DRAFT_19502 [Ascobolus immersus RN42]|uniref:Uncharacterized protein n=1 Tax=Ascobolus immersus RN42 TaxID=1160509 RepID=A0A3N4HP07_ASCIM|nr:hypothetical protein BJ508DRAFT_19502 [Ascobolus immersus RN42]
MLHASAVTSLCTSIIRVAHHTFMTSSCTCNPLHLGPPSSTIPRLKPPSSSWYLQLLPNKFKSPPHPSKPQQRSTSC